MPFRYRVFVFLTTLGLIALLAAPDAQAITFDSVDSFTVKAEEQLTGENWLATDVAKVDGTVQDDLFLLAQDAAFTGRFRCDLWCVSDTINFSGYVQQHARLIGAKTTQVRGKIDLNLIALANTVMVNKSAVIGGDVCLLGENVILEGAVGGEARLVGRQVTLGGHVGGDARLIAEDIVILPGAVIEGDIRYTSSRELILDSQVQLKGELIRAQPEAAPEDERSSVRGLLIGVYLFLGALVAGVVWLSIFRSNSVQAVNQIRNSTWRCTLAGLIAFCMIPMLAFFALFTLIGIPLGIIAGLVYIVLLYIAKIITGIAVGSLVLRQSGTQTLSQAFSAMTIGLGVLYLLASIQALTSTVWFVSTVIGLGALVLSVIMPTPVVTPPPPPLRQEQDRETPTGGSPDSE